MLPRQNFRRIYREKTSVNSAQRNNQVVRASAYPLGQRSAARMAVGLNEVTVKVIAFRFTVGCVLPKLMPVIVIVWAERSACALLIMGKGAARSDAGKANTSAKASIDICRGTFLIGVTFLLRLG